MHLTINMKHVTGPYFK